MPAPSFNSVLPLGNIWRSISVAEPTLWNALPFEISNSSSASVLKNRLKMFLFRKASLQFILDQYFNF